MGWLPWDDEDEALTEAFVGDAEPLLRLAENGYGVAVADYHDEPTPYHGVAELCGHGPDDAVPALALCEVREVSGEDSVLRLCRRFEDAPTRFITISPEARNEHFVDAEERAKAMMAHATTEAMEVYERIKARGPGMERDPEAMKRVAAVFAGAPPEWQEVFAEIDWRDPNMRRTNLDQGLGTQVDPRLINHDAAERIAAQLATAPPAWRAALDEARRRDPKGARRGDTTVLVAEPFVPHAEAARETLVVGTELWARRFAEERHKSQRYGEHPYVVHLWAVRQVLTDFGYHSGPLAVAAWLHDLIEDTPTTRQEIAERFGEEVAMLVWAVTGVGKNRKNRKERNAWVYEKIRQCPKAAILKLADRIANMEASQACPDKLAMYRKEHLEFAMALRGLGDDGMWERLRRAFERPAEQEARHRREIAKAREQSWEDGMYDDEPSAGDVAEAEERAR
jgi:guanosine-3',5'-bis(diphosphate) 3'-pyrophosphohydrolase